MAEQIMNWCIMITIAMISINSFIAFTLDSSLYSQDLFNWAPTNLNPENADQNIVFTSTTQIPILEIEDETSGYIKEGGDTDSAEPTTGFSIFELLTAWTKVPGMVVNAFIAFPKLLANMGTPTFIWFPILTVLLAIQTIGFMFIAKEILSTFLFR